MKEKDADKLRTEFSFLTEQTAEVAFNFYKSAIRRFGGLPPDLGQSLIMFAGKEQDRYLDLVDEWVASQK